MYNIITWLNGYLQNPVFETRTFYMGAVFFAAFMALVFCLFGYRRIRIISAVVGFVAGAIGGYFLAYFLKLVYPIDVAVIAGCALAAALLSFFIYRFGIFIAVFGAVWAAIWALLTKYTGIEGIFTVLIGLVAAIIIAILSAVYLRPMIIPATAVAGGLLFASIICEHLVHVTWSPLVEAIVRLGFGVFMAVIGMIYQFAVTRYED